MEVIASHGHNGHGVAETGGLGTSSPALADLPPGVVSQNMTGLAALPDGSTNQAQEVADDAPTIDIVVNNVVCSFATRCHLNLKRIALEGVNVVYKRENGMVSMKIRRPATTASIWSSGKITCTGATSEEDSKKAARRFARVLQRMGFKVKFVNFRVVNVLATCSFPFGIRITHFSRDHPREASYEPELHPGVTYRVKPPLPKATLKIFSTGSVTVTAPRVENVSAAIEHIFPLVYEYRMETAEDIHKNPQAKSHKFLNPAQRKKLKRKRAEAGQAMSDDDMSDDSELSDDDSD